jgi:hypothetical protein
MRRIYLVQAGSLSSALRPCVLRVEAHSDRDRPCVLGFQPTSLVAPGVGPAVQRRVVSGNDAEAGRWPGTRRRDFLR